MSSAKSSVDPSYARGALVADRYRVEDELGRGGMGVVLGAIDVRAGVSVALKVLRAEGLGDADTMRRLEREARALGKLSSPHVAHVHDFGYDAGAPFVVLERLTGTTLAKVLHARGRLEIDEAVTLAREIALGLQAAHAASVVHRDLKPSNVFLAETAAGRIAKIIDFGVCAMQTEGEVTITQTATTVGTPSYMAPEQVTSPRDVDSRADIWSLGVVLYEMLAGEKPFRGASMGAVFAAILSTVPPSVTLKRPDCPPALAALVSRCLERDPSLRPASADEVAHTLAMLSSGNATQLSMTVSDGALAPSAPENDVTDTIPMAPAVGGMPVPVAAMAAPPGSSITSLPPPRSRTNRRARFAGIAVLLVLVGAGVGGLAARRDTGPFAGPTPTETASAIAAATPTAMAPPALSSSAPSEAPTPATSASAPASAKPVKGTKKKPRTAPGELDPRLIDTL